MSNPIKIQFSSYVDRRVIEAPAVYAVDVEDVVSAQVFELDVNALSSTAKEAFKVVVDECSWLYAEDAYVWNIELTGKTFDLSNSYFRNAKSTVLPVTAMSDDFPLEVTFETPGFTSFNTYKVALWFGADFTSDDVLALATMGIDLTGNGSEFTIDNSVECRVYFTKPAAASGLYIVNYTNQIIEV